MVPDCGLCHIKNGRHVSSIYGIFLLCKHNQLVNYIKSVKIQRVCCICNISTLSNSVDLFQNPSTYGDIEDIITRCSKNYTYVIVESVSRLAAIFNAATYSDKYHIMMQL